MLLHLLDWLLTKLEILFLSLNEKSRPCGIRASEAAAMFSKSQAPIFLLRHPKDMTLVLTAR